MRNRLGVAAWMVVLGALSCGEAIDEGPGKAGASSGDGRLRFSAVPDHNSTNLIAKFGLVGNYLSDALGVECEYVPLVDYPALVAAFRQGEIQLAWFGGLTGVQARQAVEGARAIAQGASDRSFRSYFIAHRDTGIEASDAFPLGLAGMSFTFGSESSTSGRLMPEYYLREHTGMSPEEFFGRLPQFSGGHDLTAIAVQSGAVQAGALNYRTYDAMVKEGVIDPERCRVVWVTPDYVDYNWTAHPILDEWYGDGFVDRVQAALVGMKSPSLLAVMEREAMIPAKNEDFSRLEETARELRMVR